MNQIYKDTVIIHLLKLSVNTEDYEKAKKEWEFKGEVIDHGSIKDQKVPVQCALCGHNIRYQYFIENLQNKKKIGVGSECLGNYEIVRAGILESSLKKLKNDQYQKVYDAYRKADWTLHHIRLTIQKDIEEIGGIWGWSYPENKQRKADFESLNLNNEVMVYRAITSGLAYNLANKYGVKLRQDYIDEFMTTYPTAKKDKAGFIRR